MDYQQRSNFKQHYLDYLTPKNLLLAITVLIIINGILFFTILGLFIKVNNNKYNCIPKNPKSQTSRTEIQPGSYEFQNSPPVFTHETKWKDYTYRYYIGDDLVSWSSALTKCRDQGFEPLYVESIEEKQFLLDWVSIKKDSGIPTIRALFVWTSGYRDYNMTHWLWEATGESVMYHLFSPGEPGNVNGNERCLIFYIGDPPYAVIFGDGHCSTLGRYICKRKN